MRSLAVLTILMVWLSGCFGSPTDFQKQDASLRKSMGGRVATKTTAGVTYASIRADQNNEQILEVNDIAELAGSSLSLPPGALAINVNMNVQEAAPLATTANALDLNLGTGFSKAGAPIVIKTDKDIELLKPMTISLPLPPTAQFMLADPFENLVVLYKVSVVGSDTLKVGALLRSALSISGNNVVFASSHIGAFQVAFTEKPVQAVQEIFTQAPILTKKEEAVLLTVDVGYDKTISAPELLLDARTTSAVKFTWEKISGPGEVTFGSANTEDTKISVSKEGTYVLRLTVQSEKGDTARDDITITYDPWPVAKLAVNLINAAADAVIDISEASGTQALLSISSPEAAKISYSHALSQENVCDAEVSYTTTAPTAASMSSDGAFVFCVALQNVSGKIYYVKSPVLTRAATPPTPVVTSFAAVNGASDGYINASESMSPLPLFALQGSSYTNVEYTTVLADSNLSCDGSKTYAQSMPPNISSIPKMDGAYAVCAKLSNASSEPVYVKSPVVVRDTLPPTFTVLTPTNAGSDVYVNLLESTNGSPLWALTATGHTSIMYAVVDDTNNSASCDSSQTYSLINVPRPVDLPSLDSVYAACVKLSDSAGNITYGKSGSIIRDTAAPSISIVAAPNVNSMNAVALTINGTCGEEGQTVTVMVGGSPSTTTCTASAWSKTWDLSAFPEGMVDFVAHMEDEAGNTASHGVSSIKDTVAPTAVLVEKMASVTDQVVFNLFLQSGDVSYYRYKVGLLGSTSCTDPSGYSSYHAIASALVIDTTALPEGEIQLCMVAKDSFSNEQNVAAASSVIWEKMTKTPTVLEVASGGSHTCALFTNGRIKCWGANTQGQLGYGDTMNRGNSGNMDNNLPYVDLGSARATQVVAGNSHTCALIEGGQVRCWGNNQYGQLGHGNTVTRGTMPSDMGTFMQPTPLPDPVIKLAAGMDHTCALTAHHDVKCWGHNGYGQLGTGDMLPRGVQLADITGLAAINLGTGVKASDIAAGPKNTCAILMDSSVKCWGDANGQKIGNVSDMIGDAPGEMGDMLAPLNFGASLKVRQVAIGMQHVCFLFYNDTYQVKCLGNSINGQTGYETSSVKDISSVMGTSPSTFVQVAHVRAITAGSQHTCALLGNGQVKCWGYSMYGQLGLGDTSNRGAMLGDIETLPDVNLGTNRHAVAISSKSESTCALTDTSRIKCWGRNNAGQLGNVTAVGGNIGISPGQMGDALPDVPLGTGKPGVIKLASGNGFSCAIVDGYQLKCWGKNDKGQLGIGDTSYRGVTMNDMGAALPFVDLGSNAKAIDISLGGDHACAQLSNGSSKCWGLNYDGQLGLGDNISRGVSSGQMGDALPAISLSSSNPYALKISAGTSHTCAQLFNGQLKCWGDNSEGQLGLDTTETKGMSPSDMGDNLAAVNLNGQLALDVSAGNKTTCAILDDRNLKCWGDNSFGQLGISNNQDMGGTAGSMVSLPPVNTGSRVVQVSTNYWHTCALLHNRSVKCWGNGNYGALGSGTAASYVPVLSLLEAGRTVASLSVGGNNTCVKHLDGTVKCWGRNNFGQLGQESTLDKNTGDASLPVINLGTGRGARSITTRTGSACALTDLGLVKCWGQNDAFYPLGLEHTLPDIGSAPMQMGDYLPFIKLN